jgi:hypothetical protein
MEIGPGQRAMRRNKRYQRLLEQTLHFSLTSAWELNLQRPVVPVDRGSYLSPLGRN